MLWWTLLKLGSGSAETRRKGLRALANYDGSDQQRVLLAVLDRFLDSDSGVARQAGVTFATLMAKGVELPAPSRVAIWETLVHRITYPMDGSETNRVALMAAQIKEPAVEKAFLCLLGDRMCDPKFPDAALISRILIQCGDGASLDRVLHFVEQVASMSEKDDPQFRLHNNVNVALGWLASSGHRKCAPRLAAILESNGRSDVRERIVSCMPKLDPDGAGPILLRAIASSAPKVSDAASRMLKEVKWQPADAKQRALLATVNADWPAARDFGSEAVDPLLLVLQRPNYEHWVPALDVLREVGDGRAVPVIRALIDDLGIYAAAIPAVFMAVAAPAPPGNPAHFIDPLKKARTELAERFPRLQNFDSYFSLRMISLLNGEPFIQVSAHLLEFVTEKLVHAAESLRCIGNRAADPAVRSAADEGCLAASLKISLLGHNQGGRS